MEHGLTDAIAKAHVYASRTLLTYLVEEHSLFDSFRSLKHYFLFDFVIIEFVVVVCGILTFFIWFLY